jgi:hypothetical protein
VAATNLIAAIARFPASAAYTESGRVCRGGMGGGAAGAAAAMIAAGADAAQMEAPVTR